MSVKLTCLVENHAMQQGLLKEPGFAMLVEAGGHKLLFDAGASDAFIKNAETLNIALDDIDTVMLSHGHYDHARGLVSLIGRGINNFKLFVHRNFFVERYWHKTEPFEFYEPTSSGLSPDYLIRSNVHYAGVCTPLLAVPQAQNMYILSDFERVCLFEKVDGTNVVSIGGRFVVDDYGDEMALCIDTEEGLIVISGCGHVGAVNICEAAKKRLAKPVRAFIGGTHLIAQDEAVAQKTAQYFIEQGIETVAACHCTGRDGVELFLKTLPAFCETGSGTVLEF